ncbi:hypothetical protein NQD34_006845 [Periophthalmus magnuspinnatus]|uniref:Uncharacterized protein n=1 Tax=Periophthalmus magnuspinnatus TaxID=409849 RepID=A0A3B3ZHS4_9GOBI|nr:dual specificity protein phosphatase 2 [Periophthalmus magnuspinnatus]KAJ0019276.1 hypothetical protein NQD34_006845 [Periophthalmus magnuspinnatus]
MTSNVDLVDISVHELARVLRTSRDHGGCVVLDCRPFLDYCLAHISGSRSVNWNSVLRRRSKGSVVALEWLIPDRKFLEQLRRGDFCPLVVMDECSVSLNELQMESVSRVLLTALHSEVRTQVCFLKGGFEGFSETYPELCYSSLNNKKMTVEPNHGHTTPFYDQDGPVELLPFLFLGSAVHSSCREALAAVGITAVLNVSLSCPNLFEGELLYLRLTVEDSVAADIRACFSTAITFIDSVKQTGGRVLVHCKAGISRSAAICLAYLMHTQRVRLQEAFDFVKQRRHIISPNVAFMGQLLQFETDVLCQG